MGSIFQEISKKPYAHTAVGEWVKSKAHSPLQGGWISQKWDDFEHTYFMSDSKAKNMQIKFFIERIDHR